MHWDRGPACTRRYGCVRGKGAPAAAAPSVATRCGWSSTQPYLRRRFMGRPAESAAHSLITQPTIHQSNRFAFVRWAVAELSKGPFRFFCAGKETGKREGNGGRKVSFYWGIRRFSQGRDETAADHPVFDDEGFWFSFTKSRVGVNWM